MNKILLIFLGLILSAGMVIAEDYTTTFPITYTVKIDSAGLTLSNSFWSSTYPLSNQSITTYYKANLTYECSRIVPRYSEFEELTSGISSLLGVCSNVFKTINYTEGSFGTQLNNCLQSKNSYELDWKSEKQQKEFLEEQKENWEEELQICSDSESEQLVKLRTLENNQRNLVECQNDLKDVEDSKGSATFFASLIGIAIGYFFWGRKKETAPSEQSESGGGDEDSPKYRG